MPLPFGELHLERVLEEEPEAVDPALTASAASALAFALAVIPTAPAFAIALAASM